MRSRKKSRARKKKPKKSRKKSRKNRRKKKFKMRTALTSVVGGAGAGAGAYFGLISGPSTVGRLACTAAGCAAGNWLGGKIADRIVNFRHPPELIDLSALYSEAFAQIDNINFSRYLRPTEASTAARDLKECKKDKLAQWRTPPISIATASAASPRGVPSLNAPLALIRYLVEECGSDPHSVNDFGANAMWSAAAGGRYGGAADNILIKALVNEFGVDPNIPDDYGRTPIWIAAFQGHYAEIRTLCGLGADPSTPTPDSKTPMYAAVEYFRSRNAEGNRIRDLLAKRCIGELYKCGADPTTPDQNGETPVWIAAKQGNVECIRELCKVGAESLEKDPSFYDQILLELSNIPFVSRITDIKKRQKLARIAKKMEMVNTADNQGRTPLFIAAKAGKADVIRVLVELGANPLTPNNAGDTPLEVVPDEVKTVLQQVAQPYIEAAATARRLDKRYRRAILDEGSNYVLPPGPLLEISEFAGIAPEEGPKKDLLTPIKPFFPASFRMKSKKSRARKKKPKKFRMKKTSRKIKSKNLTEIDAGISPVALLPGDSAKVTGLINCIAVVAEKFDPKTGSMSKAVAGHFDTPRFLDGTKLTKKGLKFVKAFRSKIKLTDPLVDLHLYYRPQLGGKKMPPGTSEAISALQKHLKKAIVQKTGPPPYPGSIRVYVPAKFKSKSKSRKKMKLKKRSRKRSKN